MEQPIKIKLVKVISGGQTGADQAALRAAKKAGLATDGSMPKGWRTLEGPRPNFQSEFNMVEHKSWEYPPRTEDNVKSAGGTIRFALNFKSPGERCTLKFIKKHNKPFIDINIYDPLPIQEVVQWIKDNNIRYLNVAGNSEQTAPGIGSYVEGYLSNLFTLLDSEGYLEKVNVSRLPD